jgi:threonine/homoserine/homoserine lactone efflux protein
VRDPVVFLGVIALLTITPGADMAMVARSVFLSGRRAAFATTLGIGAGCLIWTFLPQFIGPGDPVLLLSMAMATVHIVLGIVWLSAYAWLLDHAVEAFRGSRIRRVLDSVTGAALVALGIRVAAD